METINITIYQLDNNPTYITRAQLDNTHDNYTNLIQPHTDLNYIISQLTDPNPNNFKLDQEIDPSDYNLPSNILDTIDTLPIIKQFTITIPD